MAKKLFVNKRVTNGVMHDALDATAFDRKQAKNHRYKVQVRV